jgi:hypothetical protein
MPENNSKPLRWSTRTVLLAAAVGIGLGVIIAQIGGGAFFVPCGTANAAATPVPAGAVGTPKNPNGTRPPVPAGAVCGALGMPGPNDVCTGPGKRCGFFWLWKCTDTFNVRTQNCSCECL